jgi:hypothetical protein
MRAVSMLPLAFWAALLAGCAAESPRPSHLETASSGAETGLSDRDLTLQTPAMPAVEVASAIELSRPMPEPRPAPRPRISPRPAPAPTPDPVPEASPADQSVLPVPTVAVAEVIAEPAPVEDGAGAGRELAPGKTVTSIPVSSGPSLAPAEDDSWAPATRARGIMVGGGGDRCRPRGGVRGIGIGGRIPIGVPGRRLR